HLGEQEGLLDETPAGEVRIPVLAVEEELGGLVEQLERFGKASLRYTQGGSKVQKNRLVARGTSGIHRPRLPPVVRHVEAPLASGEIALHPESVPESGPGEATE